MRGGMRFEERIRIHTMPQVLNLGKGLVDFLVTSLEGSTQHTLQEVTSKKHTFVTNRQSSSTLQQHFFYTNGERENNADTH